VDNLTWGLCICLGAGILHVPRVTCPSVQDLHLWDYPSCKVIGDKRPAQGFYSGVSGMLEFFLDSPFNLLILWIHSYIGEMDVGHVVVARCSFWEKAVKWNRRNNWFAIGRNICMTSSGNEKTLEGLYFCEDWKIPYQPLERLRSEGREARFTLSRCPMRRNVLIVCRQRLVLCFVLKVFPVRRS